MPLHQKLSGKSFFLDLVGLISAGLTRRMCLSIEKEQIYKYLEIFKLYSKAWVNYSSHAMICQTESGKHQ